jgi:preprotein translocase subunit SecB
MMQTSPLQLEGYYLEEISVSILPHALKQGGIELWEGFHPRATGIDNDMPFTFETQVGFDRRRDDPFRFKIKLTLESDNEKTPNFPYSFRIVLIGFFNVAKTYPAERVDLLVSVNGPSVLYSAAREILATVTGRSPLPAIALPTVSFQPSGLPIQENESIDNKRKTVSTKKATRSSKKGK